MKQYVNDYIEFNKNSWALATRKSEWSRLNNALALGKTPEEIFEGLKASGKKPYTIKTTFVRLVTFEAWLKAQGHVKTESFKDFYQRHKNTFKHAYTFSPVPVTFDEAYQRIMTLKDPYKTAALELLATGLRVSEPKTVKDGYITGKGGKQRRVYGTISVVVPRSSLWLQLKSVGLTPHMLRKLCATRLAEKGASPQDLCKIFGWSSIMTAYRYLQPQDDQKLQDFMSKSMEIK